MGVQLALRIHRLEVLHFIILHLWHKNQTALGCFTKCCRKKALGPALSQGNLNKRWPGIYNRELPCFWLCFSLALTHPGVNMAKLAKSVDVVAFGHWCLFTSLLEGRQ